MLTLQTQVRTSMMNLHRRLVTSAANTQKTGDVPVSANTPACGIQKWVVERKVEAVKKVEFSLPAHLIRPPCLPGGSRGQDQTCMSDSGSAFYCPPCRNNYKYPSFSDNIVLTLPAKEERSSCWWQGHSSCKEEDDEVLNDFTRPANCPWS